MVDWFSGSVTEAITAYQEKKGLLVVYIHHNEGENDSNTINFNQLWEKLGNGFFTGIPAITIRLTKDSEGAKQFSEFFPTPIFPVCYVLGLNGQPLEVITAVEPLTEHRLRTSLKKGIKLYADQLKEQGIEVPKAIESLNDPVLGTANETLANTPDVELTEEERLKKCPERLEQKRKEDAQKKEEEQRQKELNRIKEGKALLDVREKQKEREMLEAIESRPGQRGPSKEADWRRYYKKEEEIPAPAAAPAQPNKPVNSEECRIQCKFPNGSAMIKTFPSKSPLQAVVDAVKEDGRQKGPFLLVQAFPRRQLTELDKSLLDLSLTPSSALLVVPDDNQTQKRRRDVIINREDGYFKLLFGFFYTPILGIIRFISSLFNFPVGTPQPVTSSGPSSSAPSSSQQKKSKEPKEGSQRTRREGNIARLRNDADSSDENEATWNGNSTQQL
uniref:UBX domain-containing protein 4 n=1 Tax=Ditylenchus dipsaci TaxID=166011 RepID=A0A915DAY8_9BILA